MPARVKDPGEHGSGRGLAVGSGDDEDFRATKEFIVQQLRAASRTGCAGRGRARVRRCRARWRCRRRRDRAGVRDSLAANGWATGIPEVAEKIGHGRIGGGVGAGDAKSALLEHAGERGHGGAADADEVDVFWIGHSNSKSQFKIDILVWALRVFPQVISKKVHKGHERTPGLRSRLHR